MVTSKHLVAAFLTLTFERVTAGPCRPVPVSIVSSSTFDISLSSTLSLPESTGSTETLSDTSTASNLYTVATTNTAAISLSTSIILSFESTTTAPATSAKSQDIIIDTTSGTTADSTTEGSQGTTETTSNEKTTAETSAETTNPTTEETTSTAAGATSEVATTLTEATTTTTAESTSEPATSSIETTTTTASEPISTSFNLIMQGGLTDGRVLHSDGRALQLRTAQFAYPYPANYPEAVLSYDQDTQHLLLGETPVCIMYDSQGILASMSICQGIPRGQYAYLTCDSPSNGALSCNIPAMKYDGPSASLVNLGQTWSQFYFLEANKQNPGLGFAVIGRAGLTSNDIKYQNFDPISIITRAVYD
ncbi:hypothetical protein ACHAPA_008847 [Fusarium lateritium]